jgi:hypothetical protein
VTLAQKIIDDVKGKKISDLINDALQFVQLAQDAVQKCTQAPKFDIVPN